jgi:Kef-type K+ transport system membrane component KefB
MVLGLLILLASMVSVKIGLSVALVEIVFGVLAGNFLGIHSTGWIDFLAGFAGIVLTFLAGAEVDPDLMREKFKESVLIGRSALHFGPRTPALLLRDGGRGGGGQAAGR